MNHLCGLDLSSPDRLHGLTLAEAKTLSRFRAAYMAHKPVDARDQNPSHVVASTSSLPVCGWRPLDDSTLYRFLCADRRQDVFQPDKSLLRLLNALRFRRERAVDEILNVQNYDDDSSAAPLSSAETSMGICTAPPRQMARSLYRSESLASVSSIVAGRLTESGQVLITIVSQDDSECNGSVSYFDYGGNSVNDDSDSSASTMEESLVSQPTSSISPIVLAKYQRLRIRKFIGLDRVGRPVMLERLGGFMASGNAPLFTIEEWIRLYIWDLERHLLEMRRASIRTGKPIAKFIYLGDVEGVLAGVINGSVWGILPLMKTLVKTVEDHYPEIVAKVIVFNVPRLSYVVWEAVKKFLDPITVEKVCLFPGLPIDLISQLVDKSVLPVEYGGTNDIPFPKTAQK